MNDRQRGAAYVKIVWVIVPIVLFLIAGVLAYVQAGELNKTKAELDAKKKELKLADDKFKARTEHLTQVSKYVGMLGDFTPTVVEGEAAAKETQYSSPDLLKARLDELRKGVGVSGDTVADRSTRSSARSWPRPRRSRTP